MGEKTGISWCDYTWNPWQGCHKVSPGCLNCYMYREKRRYGQKPDEVKRSSEKTFHSPLRWNKKPEGRRLVFVCSWSDFFIDEAEEWRDEAIEIIQKCSNLTFLILTKRLHEQQVRELPPNVWLGVSVESNDFVWRIQALNLWDVPIKFVSYEPALGPIDQIEYYLKRGDVQWLISGGESCSLRAADKDWFRAARDLCLSYGIYYFHKQHGGFERIDGCYGGNKIDGYEWHEFPGD